MCSLFPTVWLLGLQYSSLLLQASRKCCWALDACFALPWAASAVSCERDACVCSGSCRNSAVSWRIDLKEKTCFRPFPNTASRSIELPAQTLEIVICIVTGVKRAFLSCVQILNKLGLSCIWCCCLLLPGSPCFQSHFRCLVRGSGLGSGAHDPWGRLDYQKRLWRKRGRIPQGALCLQCLRAHSPSKAGPKDYRGISTQQGPGSWYRQSLWAGIAVMSFCHSPSCGGNSARNKANALQPELCVEQRPWARLVGCSESAKHLICCLKEMYCSRAGAIVMGCAASV